MNDPGYPNTLVDREIDGSELVRAQTVRLTTDELADRCDLDARLVERVMDRLAADPNVPIEQIRDQWVIG